MSSPQANDCLKRNHIFECPPALLKTVTTVLFYSRMPIQFRFERLFSRSDIFKSLPALFPHLLFERRRRKTNTFTICLLRAPCTGYLHIHLKHFLRKFVKKKITISHYYLK